MWRYLVGALAALALAGAGLALFNRSSGHSIAALPAASLSPTQSAGGSDALPETLPAATERSREQKRFDRYDKDRNASVTREEYLAPRRKAFAKLDLNHDGMLSFDEWAAKTEAKFTAADADKSGAMNAAEFATTAPKRRTPHIRRDCPPATAAAAPEAANSEDQ